MKEVSIISWGSSLGIAKCREIGLTRPNVFTQTCCVIDEKKFAWAVLRHNIVFVNYINPQLDYVYTTSWSVVC